MVHFSLQMFDKHRLVNIMYWNWGELFKSQLTLTQD